MSRSLFARPAAALALAAALAAPAAAAAQPFTSFTLFGDSYADVGNAFRLTVGGAAAPPYDGARFSDGKVFTEYLAEALSRPTDAQGVFANLTPAELPPGAVPVPGVTPVAGSGNYAIGGATTTNAQGTQNQIALFLARPAVEPRTTPTGLYALFVGGNDLREAGTLSTTAARQAAGAAAAQNVLAQATALVGAGARNILFFTLQSPGVMPEALAVPGLSARRDEAAAAFNAALAAGIASNLGGLAPVGTTLFNFRLDNLFANLRADALAGGPRYGITNLAVPCLIPDNLPGASPCAQSAFVDGIHPTTGVHRIIGESVARYVTTGQNVALVPEPATVALVGAGVTLLGALARRRRAA